MSYFSEFNKISKSEWEKKIFSDLKEKKSSIKIEDEIEELNISSYYHSEDVFKNEIPGNFPFTRGMNKQKNDWKNGSLIIVSNEKESNKKALLALNSGADLLVFKTNKKNVNWKAVFKDIKFEFIYAQFIIESVSDFDVIFQLMKKHEFNMHSSRRWNTCKPTWSCRSSKRPGRRNGCSGCRLPRVTWTCICFASRPSSPRPCSLPRSSSVTSTS